MKQFLLTLAAIVLKQLMEKASPMVREFVCKKVQEIVQKADETDNKFDDILADALSDILGCG